MMKLVTGEGLKATTKATDSDRTVRATENPNSHPVVEGMQNKYPKPEKEDKHSFGGKSGMMHMIPANEETDPATDKHSLQHQEVTSPGGAQEPVTTQEAPPAADENKQSGLIEENRKAKRKVLSEFASSVVLLGLSELLCIKFLPKNSVNKDILEAIAILGSGALISGFCLLIHTLFMLAPSNTCIHPFHNTISKGLSIMSCASLVLASFPLSLLPKPYNLLIPIVLAAVLLTLGAHLYLRSKTNDKKTEKDQSEKEEQMKEITRVSELSQVVVSLSSSGLIGLLFGIHKNALNHAHHPVVTATVFLTFTSFIFSIFLMFLCQMRLMHLSSSTREKFLRIGLGLCKFLLVLLAFSALAISYTFLKVYTVMVFVPILIVYVVWLSIGLCKRVSDNIQDKLAEEDPTLKKKKLKEEELKLAYTKGNKVTSASFGGIMAIFSGYLGSDEKNMHINICMIFMASAFLSGLSLMLLSYKPSRRSHVGFIVSILSYYAISLLTFGLFTVFILEFIQL